MKTLSYTQKFYLCAINKKGNIPALTNHVHSGIFAGSIMELLTHGYITLTEKDKLVSGKEWDNALPYLKSLYDVIVSVKKPQTANRIADIYLMSFGMKHFEELFMAIGASLYESGHADEFIKQGLLSDKLKYIPKEDSAKPIIKKVRDEFLEDDEMDDDTYCLAALLSRSEIIRDYFSKIESDTMKKRIKEVRKSEVCATINKIIDYVETAQAAVIIVATM
jgi:hypothetical protein